jgi:hypothetical protein
VAKRECRPPTQRITPRSDEAEQDGFLNSADRCNFVTGGVNVRCIAWSCPCMRDPSVAAGTLFPAFRHRKNEQASFLAAVGPTHPGAPGGTPAAVAR